MIRVCAVHFFVTNNFIFYLIGKKKSAQKKSAYILVGKDIRQLSSLGS